MEDADRDTVIKMALETFCLQGSTTYDGQPLLYVLRETALNQYKLYADTLDFITLHLLDRCEKVDQNRKPQNISGQPYACDPRIEKPWDGKRVLAYVCAVAQKLRGAPVELLEARKWLFDPIRKDNLPSPPADCDSETEWWLVSRSGLHVNSLLFAANQIAAAIKTNIQRHFYKRQLQCIKLRENLRTWDEAKHRQEDINRNFRHNIPPTGDDSLPFEFKTESVEEELQKYPEHFLYPMWVMNRRFETANPPQKLFALLPLVHGFVPGAHLRIDTNALVFLVGSKHPKLEAYHNNPTSGKKKKRCKPGRNTSDEAMDRKDLAWEAFFHIEKAVRTPSALKRFGHFITTDGCSVSVHIAHASSDDSGAGGGGGGGAHSKATKAQKASSGRKSKTTATTATTATTSTTPSPPPALSDAEREKLAAFAKAHPLCVVGIDPGKRNLLYATNQHAPDNQKEKQGVRLRYSFGQRLHESGKRGRDTKLNKCKSQHIFDLEQQLSQHNSRTTVVDQFRAYLATRFRVQNELYAHYCQKSYRIARWHNWRGRRSSEDKFVQKLLDTFAPPKAPTAAAAAAQPKVIVAYGNGSGFHALRFSPPSPTTGLRKRLRAKLYQGLVVINTPEYRSSKMCSRCKGEVAEDPSHKRKYVCKDGTVKMVPVWGIRRCNSATCGGFRRWNRDHNAAINIRANLLHYLERGTWPQHGNANNVDEETTITAVGNL
jgi:hypothetical protein